MDLAVSIQSETFRQTFNFLIPIFPYFLITLAVWFAYFYIVKNGGFVSDDLQGIVEYDGKLQGIEYGMISRWLRYHLCGGNFPSKHKVKNPNGTEVIVLQGKIPIRHHILLVVTFNIACLLTYCFLRKIVGVKLALGSIILFAVHPCGVQAIAWCSGLGYPLSLFWISAMINLIQWFYAHQSPWSAIVATLFFGLFQFLGIHAQFVPMMTCVILLFLGYWQFAVLGALISAAMCFDIIRQTIKFRQDEFKKQQMGASTYFNPRKFIVATKTFLYYLGLTLFPNKLGLYHKWGFHYSKDLEREDWLFWLGLLGIIGLFGVFILTPEIPVKFGILWFIAFLSLFLNWVTIQQFVTERYVFIPTLGTCLIIAYFTRNHLVVYAFILGLYLCRTWLHLPTYLNELAFYQSNIWNFPDSEVAYGNLGVTYMRLGMVGTAMDTWQLATRLNPDYDVPYYNIFSLYKSNGMMSIQNGDYMGGLAQLKQALPWLEKTLACKICHFPDLWKKEHEDLFQQLKNPAMFLRGELERLEKLKIELKNLLLKATEQKRQEEINVSIRNTDVQVSRLKEFMTRSEIYVVPQELEKGINEKVLMKKLLT